VREVKRNMTSLEVGGRLDAEWLDIVHLRNAEAVGHTRASTTEVMR
jgi:hypothetical protein